MATLPKNSALHKVILYFVKLALIVSVLETHTGAGLVVLVFGFYLQAILDVTETSSQYWVSLMLP